MPSRVADEHEASAADVASLGIDDGEGEAYGYGCVDGVAALLEDGDAGVGGVVVDGDDHRVLGADGFVGLGGEGDGGERECDQQVRRCGMVCVECTFMLRWVVERMINGAGEWGYPPGGPQG